MWRHAEISHTAVRSPAKKEYRVIGWRGEKGRVRPCLKVKGPHGVLLGSMCIGVHTIETCTHADVSVALGLSLCR